MRGIANFLLCASVAVLAGALPAEALRCEWHAALQAQGPGGEDEVWAAGPFVLLRGL